MLPLFEFDKHRRGPDLRIVGLAAVKIDWAETVPPIARLDLQRAAQIARQRNVGKTLYRKEQLGASKLHAQASGLQQLSTGYLPLERRAMHERVPLKRIACLRIAVDPAGEANTAGREVADIAGDAVGIAIGIGAKSDVGRTRAPYGFFGVLEAAAGGRMNRPVKRAYCPAPFCPALAIR